MAHNSKRKSAIVYEGFLAGHNMQNQIIKQSLRYMNSTKESRILYINGQDISLESEKK